MPALVMNCLAPLITHSPSSSCARVRVLPASDPASGSVRPNAPRISPAHSRGSHSALLLVGAEQVDRLGAQRRVGAQRDRDAGVDPGQLLDRDRVLQAGAAGAADLLRERDPHPAERRHLGDDLVRERTGCGRAPRRPAPPRPARTHGRFAAAAGSRRRAQSPWSRDYTNIRSEFERLFGKVLACVSVRARHARAARALRPPPAAGRLPGRQGVRRRGYDQTTMQELAATMGLATGALYHYFSGQGAAADRDLRPADGAAAGAGHRAAGRATGTPTSSCARWSGCGSRTSSSTATTCSSSSRSAT